MEVMIRYHLFNPGENNTGIVLLAGPQSWSECDGSSDPAANRNLDYQSHSQVTIQTSRLETVQTSSLKTFRENLNYKFLCTHFAIFCPFHYFMSRISTYFLQTFFLNAGKLCSSFRSGSQAAGTYRTNQLTH